MTCEIAIMNREAVALAADSAVTIGGDKIYNSANKLFALSDTQPVGVMIFGSDNFMGVPWETILKLFRKHLGERCLDTLQEYGKELFLFIESKELNIPLDLEDLRFKESTSLIFNDIKGRMVTQINEEFRLKGNLTEEEIKKIVDAVIENYPHQYATIPEFEWVSDDYKAEIAKRYSAVYPEILSQIFENLPIKNEKAIESILVQMACKKWYLTALLSGVVIAGFGKKDLFPSLLQYDVESFLCGKLKANHVQELKINPSQNSSFIAPFAQADEAQMFMRGISPQFLTEIVSALRQQMSALITQVLNITGKATPQTTKEMEQVRDKLVTAFEEGLTTYSRVNYVDRLMNIVCVLPKPELAGMAESLVNLSSFKKKVTHEKETVGGDIDVAIISKSDGFVWIKRKRYFKEELNKGVI